VTEPIISGGPLTGEGQIEAYYDAGLKVLTLGNKNPFNPYRDDGKEWQKVHVQQEHAIAHHKTGGNIGLQMGEVSGWLCAVDMDYEEAMRLAPHFLPKTLTAGKHTEALPSHYFYRSEGADYLQIRDGSSEVVALKASARGQGHQVKVAPSEHPAKGRYEWRPTFDTAKIRDVGSDALGHAVRRLGIAALVRHHLPADGRHEYSKAIAGLLLRRGYDPDDLAEILEIVWADADAPRDGVASAVKNVHDTTKRMEDGKTFTGGKTLNESVQGLADSLVKAAGLERNQPLAAGEGDDAESADDSALARLWLYQHTDVRYSPHGWLRYGSGWWRTVDAGMVERDVLTLLDRTPAKTSHNRLKSVAALAGVHSYVPAEAWDANGNIVVCANGTLDLETFKLREHRPEDRALGGLSFDYDPSANAETWQSAIGERLLPDEWAFLQEFVGYALTTDCSYELAVWLIGERGTGKSTFVEGVQTIMGTRAAGLSMTDLERSPHALQNIVGKTLLTATEQPGSYIKYADVLNKIISGEVVQINPKNKPIIDYRSTAKILWAMNKTMQIREGGSGLFRRIHPITFPAFEGKADPTVKERIVDFEGPGILAWAAEGLKRLKERGGFDVPESVRAAMVDYEYENNPVAQLLGELCEHDEQQETSKDWLYHVYKAWAQNAGYKPLNKNNLSTELKRLKVKEGRKNKMRYWKLKVDENADEFPERDAYGNFVAGHKA
jgi:P4 family phage/plasmid primase-like protien